MKASSKCFSSQFLALFFTLALTTLLVSCWTHSPYFSPFLVSTHEDEEPPSSSSAFPLQTFASYGSHDDEKLDTNKENHRDHKYSNLERIESKLAKARHSIKEASKVRNLTSTHQDQEYVPHGSIYRYANSFHRYLEMEKVFKIFVYEEGEPPMFHHGLSKNIYSTEGMFINEMEKGRYYRTNNPYEAYVYFLPFSVVMMIEYLYVQGTYDRTSIGLCVKDYIQIISHKYPFWNQSQGHDHFMISCHDWGPVVSAYVDNLFNNSIRVLCNANTSEGFKPEKDVPFPEMNLKTGDLTNLVVQGYPPSHRTILAFFAGHLHGHIRYLLLNTWKNKDEDVQVFDELPEEDSYHTKLRSSKFCLCPSGYEVASPRIVEAIFAECVPVLISDSYVPPFSDVLNWKSFSVQIEVKEIPNIKKILMGISQRQYLKMQRRVKQVQRHFVPNEPPKRFDIFHMTIHSIWLRRLNVCISDDDQ